MEAVSPDGDKKKDSSTAAATSRQNGTATGSFWGWLSPFKEQAADIALKAQVKAADIAQKAQEKATELRERYDLDNATQHLLQGIGVSPIVDSEMYFHGERRIQSSNSLSKSTIDIHYVTENLLSMSFPYDPNSKSMPNDGNNIFDASVFLKENHEGHVMIWNISEEIYDYSLFADQVLEYKFPGHPAPPLGLLFKICTSIESWLDSDDRNVAVVHCLTGKGRTAAVMSCVLAWIGEFSSPLEALQYVADRKKMSIETLTIPSQRRYVQYFSNMLDGVKARTEPLLLRRILINSVPNFGNNGGGEANAGCCPYIQLFKNGVLIANASPPPDVEAIPLAQSSDITNTSTTTVTATLTPSVTSPSDSATTASGEAVPKKKLKPLKWVRCDEGCVSFPVDCLVRGDILIRCRHASSSGHRISMFRAAIHTGYVPAGVLRLTKSQLDGANLDDRFSEDFFIDLIFAPVDTSSTLSASSDTLSSPSNNSSTGKYDLPMEFIPVEAVTGTGLGTGTGKAKQQQPTDSGLVLEATSKDRYDQMLHRDNRFWEAIASRKSRGRKRRSRQFSSTVQDPFSITDDSNSSHSPIHYHSNTSHSGVGTAADFFDSDFSNLADNVTGNDGETETVSESPSKKSISDMDLIMQLAQAEGDDDLSLPSTPPILTSPSLSMADTSVPITTSPSVSVSASTPPTITSDMDLLGSDQLLSTTKAPVIPSTVSSGSSLRSAAGGDLQSDSFPELSSNTIATKTGTGIAAASASSVVVAVPSKSSAADLELQALEDLERELGLDGMGLSATGTAPMTPSGGEKGASHIAVVKSQAEDSAATDGLDNLDELEEYLQSLSSGQS